MNLRRNSILALPLAAVLPILVMVCAATPASSRDKDKATSATAASTSAAASCATHCSSATAASACTQASAASECCSARSATKVTSVTTARKVKAAKPSKEWKPANSRRLINTSVASAPAPAAKRAANGTAGLRVAIDPVTGQLVAPTKQQTQAMSASLTGATSAVKAAPEVITNADGSAMIVLGDRFASYAKMRKDAKGNWVYECDHSPTVSAAAATAAPTPTTARTSAEK